jgi:predicted CoA-substrate-specific enzyme activase
MDSLGICLGASTISLVRLRKEKNAIKTVFSKNQAHEGNPRRCLTNLLDDIDDLEKLKIGVTGRKFRNLLALSSISEPEAVEFAYSQALPPGHQCRVIVSTGGETFMVYHLDDAGRIQNIHTGNKCASGTGEFFLQQLGRMDLSLDDVKDQERPETIYKMSGRCSVFCKSDCTHALNKGIPKEQVVDGLSVMMAGKISELLKKLPKTSVMLVGGCTRNQAMIHYLQDEIDQIIIPDEASWFEAKGAALWALDNETLPFPGHDKIFHSQASSLSFHRPLHEFKDLVHFKDQPTGVAADGDRTILGLDVGSTTTKGVVMRRHDKAILASEYLRTNGDPIGASRQVYQRLAEQIDKDIIIEGLGVTGSGRQIAGLHAMTDGVINEIIAHATAAVHFDPEVDTIFEIGGQDAKYTYITNGVPSDYAMNEACSAGTGSFIEESAKESLGLDVTKIGETAYQATNPPNFNDQCAAFISSDIKRAVQEDIPLPDIVAGLVYSICMNYDNRVKGNRPVGKKVFIQGGVCYNKAIPAAMAALTGKEMVVPPDPGLMGAFGVALEVKKRLDQGLLKKQEFVLAELINREVKYGKSFICGGGKSCDRKCEIARIEINNKQYPFGGTCNRYDNIIHNRKIDSSNLDQVVWREKRVFRDLAPEDQGDKRPTVGMNRSFLVHTYFPFYNRFFAELGFRLVLPDTIDPAGVDQQGAPFCHPVEQAHGFAASLLKKNPDYYFMPHLQEIDSGSGDEMSCTCVFVQAEPYYLKATFPDFPEERTLSPTLNFSKGINTNKSIFMDLARRMGVDPGLVESAMQKAITVQEEFGADLQHQGREALAMLGENPETPAVVLFGRPYNSFTGVANKGIPAKFASRGNLVIPFDMLPFADEELEKDHNMYWGMGRMILKAAHYVKKHPHLFGTYITNFSCGPDSFIVGFFRSIMGRKPSLTLELDSHTADAGLETRIEAFLDIVGNYRQAAGQDRLLKKSNGFHAAGMEMRKGKAGIRDSDDNWVPLSDKRVKVVLPAMGKYGTPLLAQAFARVGIRAEALPPANEDVLKLGRGNSSCKECLPLQTTVGSMLHYLNNRPAGELTAFFMATATGPCRFGQYHVFSKRVVEKHQIADAAVLSLTSLNGYGGMGHRVTLAAWRAITIGDILDEVWATILAAAVDPEQGVAVLNREFEAILPTIDKSWRVHTRQLSRSARKLAMIPLKKPYHEIPKLSLIGEIYVRHDPISLQGIIEKMAARGFIVRTAPTTEWLKYLDWLIKEDIEGNKDFGFHVRYHVKSYIYKKIRQKLAPSGLFYTGHNGDVEPAIDAGKKFVSPNLTGETILTVGSAIHEILHPSCGVISIGPFGCMPCRVAEAILNEKFNSTEKLEQIRGNGSAHLEPLLTGDRKFPFLAIETDGNPFPQVIESRLEALCLQAGRLNDQILAHNSKMEM